jgi:aminoglycoside phosphotransferase (APT) family kinase protein
MSEIVDSLALRATGAECISSTEVIQELWSGYGSIVRYHLVDGAHSSVIVKHVAPPDARRHPRGWNTDRSHQRKIKSYAVETEWYRTYAAQCGASCRVPTCYAVEGRGDEVFMVIEDLDAAGYAIRRTEVDESALRNCLSWLAHFHATFLSESSVGLWESGCYWHLQTRLDELDVLAGEDADLWNAAAAIDAKLSASRYQTLVHGDAKLANFCFSAGGASVAAVDFQYVGAGCGMKDLAYFIGSCLNEASAESSEAWLLDTYFDILRREVSKQKPQVDVDALEAEWRALYAVAWTDFHRFLKGWSPGHWKINAYSERLAREVVADLKKAGLCS